MTISSRDNFLRAITFTSPKWIPHNVFWPPATWYKYGEALEDLVLKHSIIFDDAVSKYKPVKGLYKLFMSLARYSIWRKGNMYKDEWGCVWSYVIDGIEGQVVVHPLEDIGNLKLYRPPNSRKSEGPPYIPPLGGGYMSPYETWDDIRARLSGERKAGLLVGGSLPHGFMFQRIYYLRGLKAFMIDLVREAPHLLDIINMVLDYNLGLIERWLEMGVDVMFFGDDLGAQDRPFISPRLFRKYFIPAYREMFKKVHEAGAYVYLHSDGHIIELIPDLIEAGVDVINPQDKVNGIDNLERICKGRVCMDVDVDRQKLLPKGTPEAIEAHVKEIVTRLGSKKGGLMLKADCYPDVPLSNIEALCLAIEKYRGYYGSDLS